MNHPSDALVIPGADLNLVRDMKWEDIAKEFGWKPGLVIHEFEERMAAEIVKLRDALSRWEDISIERSAKLATSQEQCASLKLDLEAMTQLALENDTDAGNAQEQVARLRSDLDFIETKHDEFVAHCRKEHINREEWTKLGQKLSASESARLVERKALEFIAHGCLVPPDGGDPKHPEDCVKAAQEALSSTPEPRMLSEQEQKS